MVKHKKLTLGEFLKILFILVTVAFIDLCGNKVGYSIGILEALPGMLILLTIGFAGIMLTYIIPINCPSVVYISLIGVAIAGPWSPISDAIVRYTDKIGLLPVATCILGYSGIVMAKNWADFKKIGLRGIFVVLLVMIGTYIGSAIIAHLVLAKQGII